VRKGRGPIQFVDVISIDTANEEVDHSQDASIGYVSRDGRDLDVTFFPTWLQGITSKPVEKSWIGLFCSCLPVRDIGKRVGMRERRIVRARVEGFQMGEGGDGTDLVRAACWKPRARAALLHSARAGRGRQ